jgi:transposase-like protein
VVIGVRADGRKELLAIEVGYRESQESGASVLRSLRERGLTAPPLLAVGDGALGLWAALHEIFPETRHQRRRNHRTLNVLDTLPRRLQADACQTLHAMYEASDCQSALSTRSPTAPNPALRDRRVPLTA